MKIWHPYTQEATESAPLEIIRGEGAYLYTRDGRLLDAISSWWVNVHGHSHPLIAEAIAAQARQLEHVIFAGFTHRAAEELAEALGRHLPSSLNRVFYSDNGSTAVEVALKIAVQYWHNKGKKKNGESSLWSTPITAIRSARCLSARTRPLPLLSMHCGCRCCVSGTRRIWSGLFVTRKMRSLP
jgi:adenosylmethionine-8-amino-7-oxononanoate aminotransferase